MAMVDCSEKHQLDLMMLIDTERSIWTGTMRSQSGCAHQVMARLITASTSMPDTLEKEFQELRIKSQWLAHVCPFYGIAPADSQGTFLLTQQYNESLQAKIQRGNLTAQEIQRYGTNILCGVGVLHSADIVCGGIEPSTIFLDGNGFAHINVITPIEKPLCVDDSSFGDNYAAPETWKSSNKVGNPFSKTSDVWSIGCTLLKMCTGKSLWDELSGMEILEYAKENILPLHLDELQGPLSNLICECLDYDAEKRPKLHQVQERFLSFRQHVCPHPNPRRRKLQTSDTESGGGGNGGGGDEDHGEDDSQERDCISACKEGLLEDLEKLLQKETEVILEGAQALCLAISLKQLHEKGQ